MSQAGGSEPREAPEPPPPLGSWNRMYGLVLGVLVVLIVAFTLFTRFFE